MVNSFIVKKHIAKAVSAGALACLLLFAASGRASAAEQETAVQTVVTAKVENPQSRSYEVNVKLWSDPPETFPETAAVLVLDVSPDMMILAQSPQGTRYRKNTLYESIDEKAQLYTEVDGVYRKILLQDSRWYLCAWDEAGNQMPQEDSIGTHNSQGDTFAVPVTEKGGAKTLMEYQTEAAVQYITELSAVSPQSKLGIVFYSGEATVIDPVRLNTENTEQLLEELSAAKDRVAKGSDCLKALEETAWLLQELQYEAFDSRSVVLLSGSACTREDSLEENITQAAGITAEMRQAGTGIYTAALLTAEEETRELLSAIATNPLEQCRKETAPAGLSQVLHSFLSRALGEKTVTVTMALDPRFALTEVQKIDLLETGGKLEILADGSQSLSWPVSLPYAAENPWLASFFITAREDFVGGNDIPFVLETAGVYFSLQKLSSFTCPLLNVPVTLAMNNRDVKLFLGQTVPGKVMEQTLEESMRGIQKPNWYGKGETGSLTALWSTEEGAVIGTTQEMLSLKPGKSGSYKIGLTYTPKTSGVRAVGTPNEEKKNSAVLRVEVVSGSIRVKLNLQENMDTAASYVFRLSKGTDVRYTAINLSSRNEDGEGIVLEGVFDDLPYGVYTLTQESYQSHEDGMYLETGEEITCRLGFASDSDKIDLENNLQVLYAASAGGDGQIHFDTHSTQVKVHGYDIRINPVT